MITTKNVLELRELLGGMKLNTSMRINERRIYRNWQALFQIDKEKKLLLEHTVKILAGDNYLTVDPYLNRRRKVK